MHDNARHGTGLREDNDEHGDGLRAHPPTWFVLFLPILCI